MKKTWYKIQVLLDPIGWRDVTGAAGASLAWCRGFAFAARSLYGDTPRHFQIVKCVNENGTITEKCVEIFRTGGQVKLA